tara:strand:- start:146 stop:1183 length:1038 start_codon:yes stop_codon:yes gene_type:complete
MAKKTNNAIYEEPFDLAAGGASLTRASQEAVLVANPALLPYGEKWHRWFGNTYAVTISKKTVGMQSVLAGAEGGDSQAQINALLAAGGNIHGGLTTSLTYVNQTFGLGMFSRTEPDLEPKQIGAGGTPALVFSMESYSGFVASGAIRPFSWLSIGVTAKYLIISEPDPEYLDLADPTIIAQYSQPEKIQELTEKYTKPGTGVGGDVGVIMFFQNPTFDFMLGLKADDVGGTTLTAPQDDFKQTVSGGVAFVIHGTTEAIHLSLDYRDILGAYEEKLVQKVYAGAKVVIRNYVGVAVGAYQGMPTCGVRFDLVAFQLGFTYYGREMGSYLGEKRRNLYMIYLAMGS